MYENYNKYGLMITPKLLYSFFATEKNSVIYTSSIFLLICQAVLFTFIIEKEKSKSKTSDKKFNFFHGINLTCLLTLPLFFHKYELVNPCNIYILTLVSGVVSLSLITVIFLKLFSYIHFWNDVRLFIQNRERLIKKDTLSKTLQGEVYQEIENVIDAYPKNIKLKKLIEFLFIPVLCFQSKYPRTKRISKSNIINYALQFFLCITLLL